MELSPLRRLRRDFARSHAEKRGAIACSIAAAISYLLLLVVLYLFVDLLVWQGRIPTFAQLSPSKQKEFESEWAARPESQRAPAAQRAAQNEARARRIAATEAPPVLTPGEWEMRWQANTYLTLREHVSQAAADAFLPDEPAAEGELFPRLGILSLVVRERNRWTGGAISWLASWNSWAWRPGADGSANTRYLTGLFLLGFVLLAIRGVMVNAIAYLTAAVTLDFVTRLRRAIYLHTYRLGSLAVRTVGPAEACDLFTKQSEAVGAAIPGSLTANYRSPILVLGLIAFILLLNFWLAVSFLLLAALVWLIAGQIVAHYRREGRLGSRHAESALALLVESLSLLRLVKCFQMERFNQNRVERQLSESGRASWRKLRGEAMAGPLLGSVALIAGAALLYLAGRSALSGEFSVAGLASMVVAVVSLGPPVAAWVDHRLKLRRGREAADAIGEFLDRRGEAAEAADAEYLPALTTRMEFRSVTLKEPGTGRNLLENVSFAVPAGARVAIVGPDAFEKRSLVYLIPRFLDPSSGEIRIEDKNIRWVTHESLRAHVAVVMQDDLTFTDTAANNIGCGDAQYNLPQIIEAAKLAHAHQFIEKLPYGYETLVGEQGHSLKPGERFRLALARALLRDPSIMIIEEPGGPVDEDTLALLDDTMERASHGRTILFLANRLSTLRNVDRVFLLQDGHLEASGSHRDLWQNNEYYRRLQMVADATAEASSLQGLAMSFDMELSAALEAAERASNYLRREYESFTAIPDAPVSISTHADKASQDSILKFLHEKFPADALCAEESIPGYESVPRRGKRTWVVDPIDDGTRGFAKKMGQFSVMIGMLLDGKPVVGVVAEPAQQRMTYARHGGGCWAHVADATALRCRVSRREPGETILTQSWLKTGQSSKPIDRLKPARVIETYSGGVKLALVARGDADVYANTYETFYDWDICAGHVLVTEAGGTVTDLAGGEILYQASDFSQRRGLLASSGRGHDIMVERLAGK